MENHVEKAARIFDNWPAKLTSLWPVLISVLVLIGGSVLLAYLRILGIESVFPDLLDQTSLFIFMAAMTGLLTFYLAFSLAFPLISFTTPEVPEQVNQSAAYLDKPPTILMPARCGYNLSRLRKAARAPKHHWFVEWIVVLIAMMITWPLPLLAANKCVGFGIYPLLVLAASFLTAIFLTNFFQGRPTGSQLMTWFWFLLMGFLSACLFAWILIIGFSNDKPQFIEFVAYLACVTVIYAIYWALIHNARRQSRKRWTIHFIVLIGFAGMILIPAHKAIFIAAGKFAKIERSNQKVLLPGPLPPEILLVEQGRVTGTNPVKGRADSSTQTWLHFTTSFHFGSLDVLCNPKVDAKGRPSIAANGKENSIAEICLVVRDGRPISTFYRARLVGTGSGKDGPSPDGDESKATSSHTPHHDPHAAQ